MSSVLKSRFYPARVSFRYKTIQEQFSTTLFSNSLFSHISDDEDLNELNNSADSENNESNENNENSASSVDTKLVTVVKVESKKDAEYFLKQANVDIVHSANNVNIAYMFTVKDKRLDEKLTELSSGDNVYIVNTFDNKVKQKSVAISLLTSLSIPKSRANKIFSFMSGAKNGYENIVPVVSECLYSEEFLELLSTGNGKEVERALFLRKVQEKEALKPPWEWTGCFAESDFKGFSVSLMYFVTHYSVFYLYRRMREDLGCYYSKALSAENDKAYIGGKMFTSAEIKDMREVVEFYYKQLLDSYNNGDMTFSVLSVKLWDIVSR